MVPHQRFEKAFKYIGEAVELLKKAQALTEGRQGEDLRDTVEGGIDGALTHLINTAGKVQSVIEEGADE